jgi:hypothetical protein
VCFYKSKFKAEIFYELLTNIVDQFNRTNKLFIDYFLELRKIIIEDRNLEHKDLPEVSKTIIFLQIVLYGGEFPISEGQIEIMLKLISKVPHIKGLSFVFTRMRNNGLKHLAKWLQFKRWRGFKIDEPTLYYLNLSFNFFNWDGIRPFLKALQESIPVDYAIENKVSLNSGIRVLILDHNYIATKGASIIGKSLPKFRALQVLSLEMNRISDLEWEDFFQGLKESRLKYLSLASNPLWNAGISLLSEALRVNKHLKFLDLFDVSFSDEGAIPLTQMLLENTTLKCLYLSNTKVSYDIASKLIQALILNKSLFVFKWSNLHEIPDNYDFENRLIDIESRRHRISKATFKTETRLDPVLTLIEDLFKCPSALSGSGWEEFMETMHRWVDYVLANWIYLQKGIYGIEGIWEDAILLHLPTAKLLLPSTTLSSNSPSLTSLETSLLSLFSLHSQKALFQKYFPPILTQDSSIGNDASMIPFLSR